MPVISCCIGSASKLFSACVHPFRGFFQGRNILAYSMYYPCFMPAGAPSSSDMKDAEVSDADLRLNKQSLTDDPFWRNCEDSAYVSLMTAGGGDCAVHAAIGSCSERGLIEVSDPRAWIQQVLSRYETAQTCVSALESISCQSFVCQGHVGPRSRPFPALVER